jgi:thiol-disulfide isomerase/thioredoxin
MYGSYNSAYPEKKPELIPITESKYIKDIQSQNFGEMLQVNKIVIVKAWASWCEPCKIAKEKTELLASQLTEYIDNNYICFLNDNIDHENSYHKKKVDVIPTFFVYFRGTLGHVYTGVEFDELVETIKVLLSQPDHGPVPVAPVGPGERSGQQNIKKPSYAIHSDLSQH